MAGVPLLLWLAAPALASHPTLHKLTQYQNNLSHMGNRSTVILELVKY